MALNEISDASLREYGPSANSGRTVISPFVVSSVMSAMRTGRMKVTVVAGSAAPVMGSPTPPGSSLEFILSEAEGFRMTMIKRSVEPVT